MDNNAYIDSRVEATGKGKGGGIEINTGSLSLTNGTQLSSSTLGEGDAGNITINANSITANTGAYIVSNSYKQGNAGNIKITAKDTIFFDGTKGSNNNIFSNISSSLGPSLSSDDAIGKPGDIAGLFRSLR